MSQQAGGALQQLRDAKPGERFQAYHHAAHEAGSSRTLNLLATVAGIAIIVVGIVALPAPGPGWLIIAIGGALIARQSITVARGLDRGELGLRRLLRLGVSAWRKASLLERGIFAVVVTIAAMTLGYVALFWLLRG